MAHREAHKGPHSRLRGALSWEMLLGLVATAFIIYVWAWAATQGGPPW
ncbi:hypothetical protein [Actinomadura livida]|nr:MULTISPECIES: hypothetical protein [Actinomadura]MBB4778865.1 hypothetical protein [Actinomadura catellatispora]